ncbi:MAG: IclR family transcriptional regulator [Lactobacillales bacterium]|jgi:DNA-binding IclR family transcriptional regulator|nr:IclR family transcriptional regulator [Lactobacillales bacterium]
MPENKEKTYGSVLVKAIEILDYLRDSKQAPTATDMVRDLALTKSTLSKILQTMQYYHLVEKENESNRYSMGGRLIGYGEKASAQFSIEAIVHPYMESLLKEIGETVHLGVEENDYMMYIQKMDSTEVVHLRSRIGETVRLYSSAMGKAVLASKSASEIRTYMKKTTLEPLTTHTITDKKAFEKEIQTVQKLGYAVDNRENEDSVYCIGVALVKKGKIYGALSISVPLYRLTDEKKERIIQGLLFCKGRIEEEI